MAEYSYWFSKASENMQAGFGIYHIAEEKVKEKLRDMSFAELVKVSTFLLGQNIGSNEFLI